MALKQMKTLTLEGSEDVYEIVDEYAREQLKNAGGGAKVFNVTFTTDEELSGVTADKTIAEIITAYNNGQLVIGLLVAEGQTVVIPITMIADNDGVVVFSITYGEGNINIAGVDGTAMGIEDMWTAVLITLASDADVDKKIAEAIGTVENGSY